MKIINQISPTCQQKLQKKPLSTRISLLKPSFSGYFAHKIKNPVALYRTTGIIYCKIMQALHKELYQSKAHPSTKSLKKPLSTRISLLKPNVQALGDELYRIYCHTGNQPQIAKARLAERFSISKKHIGRWLDLLKDSGVLRKIPQYVNGQQMANLYVLTDEYIAYQEERGLAFRESAQWYCKPRKKYTYSFTMIRDERGVMVTLPSFVLKNVHPFILDDLQLPEREEITKEEKFFYGHGGSYSQSPISQGLKTIWKEPSDAEIEKKLGIDMTSFSQFLADFEESLENDAIQALAYASRGGFEKSAHPVFAEKESHQVEGDDRSSSFGSPLFVESSSGSVKLRPDGSKMPDSTPYELYLECQRSPGTRFALEEIEAIQQEYRRLKLLQFEQDNHEEKMIIHEANHIDIASMNARLVEGFKENNDALMKLRKAYECAVTDDDKEKCLCDYYRELVRCDGFLEENLKEVVLGIFGNDIVDVAREFIRLRDKGILEGGFLKKNNKKLRKSGCYLIKRLRKKGDYEIIEHEANPLDYARSSFFLTAAYNNFQRYKNCCSSEKEFYVIATGLDLSSCFDDIPILEHFLKDKELLMDFDYKYGDEGSLDRFDHASKEFEKNNPNNIVLDRYFVHLFG